MQSAFGSGSGMGRLSNADDILRETMGRTSGLHARTRATIANAQGQASAFNSGIMDIADQFRARQAPLSPPPQGSPPAATESAFGPMGGPSQGMNVPPAQEGAFGGPTGGQAMITAPAGTMPGGNRVGGNLPDSVVQEVASIFPPEQRDLVASQLKDPAVAQRTLDTLNEGRLTPEMESALGPGMASLAKTRLGQWGVKQAAGAVSAFSAM